MMLLFVGEMPKHICLGLVKQIQLQVQACCALGWSAGLALMCFICQNINVKVIALVTFVIFQKWVEESYIFTLVKAVRGKEEPKEGVWAFSVYSFGLAPFANWVCCFSSTLCVHFIWCFWRRCSLCTTEEVTVNSDQLGYAVRLTQSSSCALQVAVPCSTTYTTPQIMFSMQMI